MVGIDAHEGFVISFLTAYTSKVVPTQMYVTWAYTLFNIGER